MAYAPIILAALSTVVAVVGAQQQAKAHDKSMQYNAQVAEQNAAAARAQAQQEAVQLDRLNRQRLGASRAAIGAAGITAEGSALDVLGDVISQGELQKQDAVYRGELQARGHSINAALSRTEGKNARTAGRISAGSALLAGSANTYDAGVRLNLGGGT